MKQKLLYLLFLILSSFDLSGQGRNATWCFGDSAGIKFITGGIVGITSMMQSHEASASISDTTGNLIFYTGRKLGGPYYSTVFNNQHQIVSNGDSIISTSSATQGLIILPFSNNAKKYSLYSIGFLPNLIPLGLFSSIVDMNSGAGIVTFKNQIIDTLKIYSEKMIAIKHGNGRDWWLINHENNSDLFILRLIQNNTIISLNYQNIGSYLNSSDSPGQMVANLNGNTISIVGSAGTINVFDFDRCSGVLSNYFDLSDNPLPGFDRYYGSSISPENFLYYSTFDSLWQIDLNAANPILTKFLVYADQNGNVCMGQHQLGPDGKIYIANAMPCGYPSTITDSLNTNLTVIDQPDSSGLACNVLPYFQPIGGIRSYLGLPNLPNYELGALTGSPCDTITSVVFVDYNSEEFEILPNPARESIRLNFSRNPNYNIIDEVVIFNAIGTSILNFKRINASDELGISQLSEGLFFIRIRIGNFFKTGKFLKM